MSKFQTSLAVISVTVQLWIQVFWVISVQFNSRNTLPKYFTFLLGHPVHIYIYIYIYFPYLKSILLSNPLFSPRFSLRNFLSIPSVYLLYNIIYPLIRVLCFQSLFCLACSFVCHVTNNVISLNLVFLSLSYSA